MPKLQQIKATGQMVLTLPAAVCRSKGWQKGDEIFVGDAGTDALLLRKIKKD